MQGGGNDAARKTWLAAVPPVGQSYGSGRRPKKGDKVDVFKQFIIDCYEQKMFHGDVSNTARRRGSGSGTGSKVGAEDRKSKIVSRTLTPKPPAVSSFEKSSSDIDLLNFDSQEQSSSFAGNQQSSDPFVSTNPITVSAPQESFNEFNNFGNFDSPVKKKDNVFDFSNFDNSISSSPAATSSTTTGGVSQQQNNTFDAFGNDFNSGGKSSGGDLLDVFGSNGGTNVNSNSSSENLFDMFSTPANSSSTATNSNVDIFGSGEQPLISSTSSAVPKKSTGLEGGGMSQMQGQRQQPLFGGGAAAISNLGGLMGGGPMGGRQVQHLNQQQQMMQQRNQFDFVGNSMKSELGVNSQNQSKPNTMLMQSPPSNSGVSNGVNSNTGLQGGMGMGMGMGGGGIGRMGATGISMGGGSGAISNMNSMVQQQNPKRRGSKGKSANFPSAW